MQAEKRTTHKMSDIYKQIKQIDSRKYTCASGNMSSTKNKDIVEGASLKDEKFFSVKLQCIKIYQSIVYQKKYMKKRERELRILKLKF